MYLIVCVRSKTSMANSFISIYIYILFNSYTSNCVIYYILFLDLIVIFFGMTILMLKVNTFLERLFELNEFL